MKKLTIEGLLLKEDYEDQEGCSCHISPPCNNCTHPGHPVALEESPEYWNSVSTMKAGTKWFATYSAKKADATVTIGTGDTEQEAIDNLEPEDLL